MNFWFIAIAGFIVVVSVMLVSLSLPTMMMGQSNERLWLREVALVSAVLINQLSVLGYMAGMTWLEGRL